LSCFLVVRDVVDAIRDRANESIGHVCYFCVPVALFGIKSQLLLRSNILAELVMATPNSPCYHLVFVAPT
ncbi:unnamed protein product, partial [Linum tenue]